MNPDHQLKALTADVEAAKARVTAQMKKDPDHEVALAMFRADLRRAKRALEAYEDTLQPQIEPQPGRRVFIDGRRAA